MLKGLVAWWGRNPVAGNLLMVFCVIAGFMSYGRMEKEFWPAGRDDGVFIEAVWPGASPEDMESQVIRRIEEATADLNGVRRTRSRSQEGYGFVYLQGESSADVDVLTQQAEQRVDTISGLPASLEPIRVQRQVNRDWSFIFSVHGDVGERVLRDTAERLRDRLALIPGATNTAVYGVRDPEVSIELSEEAMRGFGLTFDDVAQAVRGQSINLSAGTVKTDDSNFQLRTRNLADTRYDFANIIVRQTPDGGIVRLGDIATVVDGFVDENIYSRMNGEPAATVTIQTADRFNIQDVNKRVQTTLTEFGNELPAGVDLTTVYNQTEDYNALLGILFSNALQGFVLIFVLLMLSLHPKVAFWSTIGVMTAFAGSFFILPYVDVSLNFMSVFGFLLVLGIMVDDAIIVGEAVYERAERGHTGVDNAIFATQLVLKPLVASVFVTMIAFSPWILIQGDAQQFTRAISLVVMSTLVFSLIESLIILPAHLAHVKKPDPQGNSIVSRLMRAQQVCAHSVLWVARRLHGPVVRRAVKLRYLTWAAFAVAMILAVGLMASNRVKQTFMPEIEGDFMIATITLPQTAPFARMEQVAAQLDDAREALEIETQDRAFEDPNTGEPSRGVVRSWSQSIEGQSIRAYVGLTPPETRQDMRSKVITARLEELLGEVPDAEEISFSLSGSGPPRLEVALMGENGEDLRAAVEEVKAFLLGFDAVTSVRDSEDAAIEELRFTLQPGAEQLGLDLSAVTRQVRQAYFGEEVQRLPRDGDDVRVYVRYPLEDRRTLQSLGDFRVRTNDGREVPLSSVASWEFAPGVTGLDRRDRMSSIVVSADLTANEERNAISTTLKDDFFPELEARYPTVSQRPIGEAEGQAEFMGQLGFLMLLALAGIYFLLAVTFRSYFQPVMILTVIWFTLFGAVVGHFMLGVSWALFSTLGMIAAIGVVVNDNVVLVDRANQIRGYFALRRKNSANPRMIDEADYERLIEVETPQGAWELMPIDKEFELHDEFVREAIAADFASGPVELRHSSQMRWDKTELREHASELEGIGFQVARVKAERGIVEASISRFRQIFLTSVTEFIGLAPMILETAVIVQFLKPMAIALAFGVLFAMPATLILTPALYLIGIDIKKAIGFVWRNWLGLANGRRAGLAPAE